VRAASLLLLLAACGAGDADGTDPGVPADTDTDTDADADADADGDTDADADADTDTAPWTDTAPFEPFVGTVTVLADGVLLGDGATVVLNDATVGYEVVTTSLLLSNPTDAAIELPGDPADWLQGDARVGWAATPPASLDAGATAELVLELVPDADGPVGATLELPADPPVTLNLEGVVHGPVPTVIVGRMGRTLVSWDHGLTWDDRQENQDPYADEWRDPTSLQSLTYGDGRFVAVGGGDGEGRIAWSVDGTSWTDVEDPGDPLGPVQFGRLADGTGRFAALRGNDWVWSDDGEIWVTEAHDGWEGQNAIAFGNGRWVTVGNSYRGVSLDGQTWHVEIDGASLSGLAFGNGVFVAVGSGGVVSWSTDGETWNDGTLGTVNRSRVAFGDGVFLTGGWPEGMYSSPDGQTWTPTGSPDDVDVLGFSNGLFVASTWRDRLWTSPDGVAWTMVQENTDPEWAGFTSMAVAEPPHR